MPINDDKPNDPLDPVPGNHDQQVPEPQQATRVDAPAPTLSAFHRQLLEQMSGISAEIVRERGYFTATTKEELAALNFSPRCSLPALVCRIFDLDGKICLYQARPDHPRKNKAGKVAKYELPKDSKRKIDVPPGARKGVLNPTSPLFITIGVRQADAAVTNGLDCVALLDVWGWLKQKPFWDRVPLEGRKVFIVFDSEICINVTKQASAFRLKEFLQAKLAHVQFVLLPGTNAGDAVALDDFFAKGNTVADLLQWATPELPFTRVKSVGAESPIWYRCTPGGIFLEVVDRDGGVTPRQLTNFPARILAQLEVTDDVTSHLELEIEAIVGGRTKRFEVRAEKFPTMAWVDEELGPEAIILPGPWQKEHARAAIQALSMPIPVVTVYESLGWIVHEGKRIFRHAGGIIGADSATAATEKVEDRYTANCMREKPLDYPVPNVPNLRGCRPSNPIRVRPPESLMAYVLPEPISGTELIKAIKASLTILDLAPPRYIAPLYVAPWRAALGPPDFSLYAVGKTGSMKSETVALVLQHLGAGLNRKNLPANWDSTTNAILAFMHQGKDLPVAIDDWLARGSKSDIDRKNRDADMVLRSQGNLSGRARCNRDGAVRAGKRPRCFTIVTGEDLPQGSSLHPRFLPLALAEYDVKRGLLSKCQENAARGIYAQSMAGYIRWLLPRYDAVIAEFQERKLELRGQFANDGDHPRIAENAADLLAGFEPFLNFAEDAGAITEHESKRLWQQLEDALVECIEAQNIEVKAQDPIEQFLELIASALLCGRAHLAGPDGGVPQETGYGVLSTWGWVEREEKKHDAPSDKKLEDEKKDATNNAPAAVDDGAETEKEPIIIKKHWARGKHIGWIAGDNVYLDGPASLAVAQEFAGDRGDHLAIGPKSVGKLLYAANKLLTVDLSSDHPYQKWTTLQGSRHRVFHISTSSLHKPVWWNEKADGDFSGLLDA